MTTSVGPSAEFRYPRPSDSAGRSSTVPAFASTTLASNSTSTVSRPWHPAFIRTAPPTDPGTPTKNSSPPRPQRAAWRATTGSDAPAAALTSPEGSSSTVVRSPTSRSTKPLKPESAITRLDPLPRTSSSTPAAVAAFAAVTTSSSEAASTSQRAGPPSLYVVRGASSALGRARPAATRVSMGLVTFPTSPPATGPARQAAR